MTSLSHIHMLDQLVSTQDAVHLLAADGAPAGTTVVAAVQAAGRGSRGRRWHSPRGGLWLSVLLRPRVAIGVEILSLRVGLAVATTLDAVPGLPSVQLKWPNDLLLANRKIGGILCEARWQGATLGWITVGLGINVTNPLPDDVSPPPARLVDFGAEITPAQLAVPVAQAIADVPTDEEQLSVSELAAFAARDWLKGRTLTEPVAGRAAGITPDGALLVRTTTGGEERVRAGSVVLAGR